VRIGLKVSSAGSGQLRIASAESGANPTLVFYATSPDTSLIAPRIYAPRSNSPDSDYTLNSRFRDRTVIVKAQPGVGSDLAVGGIPGRRTYMRFALPDSIVDSSTVTRAVLILTQRADPASARDHTDSLTVYPAVVLAGSAVTDLRRAATITTNTFVTTDSLRLSPHDGSSHELDVTRLLRVWKGQKPDVTPRALVLITQYEGATPLEVRFHSSEDADPQARPRLRISYIPRVGFGIP
jgi:hypothetical protein